MKKFCLKAVVSAAAALAVAVSGCASKEKTPPPRDGELAGTFWKPVGSPRGTYIEFTGDGRMVGNAGRNRFFGPVVYAKGKRIRLGPLAATRIPGPERKYEEKFYEQIEETRGYVFEEDKLTLYNEEREPVMELARIKVEVPKP